MRIPVNPNSLHFPEQHTRTRSVSKAGGAGATPLPERTNELSNEDLRKLIEENFGRDSSSPS